ncbi:MAG TPA: PQQ-binding-like beta-propeller repeat protein [Gemmataceae bacterium]|nr:PQQ-binding-like beta-propeller repeat protein [Gemmataceae bacterium]
MPWFRALAALIIACSFAQAADWPQWLGPNRDGVSIETVAPWKGPLKVLWKQPLGEGHSSPVVADGRVFVHTKGQGNEESVQAFDAKDGKPLWTKSYAREPYKGLFGAGPRATPTVAAQRVYTYGITGVLSCYDTASGRVVWQVNALKEFKAPKLFFGASCSPLVDGNVVLVNVGGQGASVVAFHKDTGKTVWQKLDDGASYSSPIVFGEGKARQAVFLTQEGLVALHPADGTHFWRFPLKDRLLESSVTPVRAGGLLVGSAITAGTVGLRLKVGSDKSEVSEAWKNTDVTCYFATPVPVGNDQLYLVTGSLAAKQAVLRCLETATGKELWKKGGVGVYHASLLRTGDGKLLMLEEKGNLVLVEPDAKGYRELARASICGNTWAHPAVANGRLYIRDGKELICVELPQ